MMELVVETHKFLVMVLIVCPQTLFVETQSSSKGKSFGFLFSIVVKQQGIDKAINWWGGLNAQI